MCLTNAPENLSNPKNLTMRSILFLSLTLACWFFDSTSLFTRDVTAGPATTTQRDSGQNLWCLQPLQRPQPTFDVKNTGLRDPIDVFVHRKLQDHSLQPNSETHLNTLLRRLSIDLVGLTPRPAEMDKWSSSGGSSERPPDAYEKTVDRLLASPRFGERWGRHWLDLAQFADSIGTERSFPNQGAWRYRDFVIDAFNQGTPLDQFVIEQIAGDLLPWQSVPQRAKQIVATQFLTMLPANLVNQFKEQLQMDIVDSQIDKIGRVFMGLTLSCARCHDHKFDPVSQTDYYALAGILHNVQVLDGFLGNSGVFSNWHRQSFPETDQQRAMRTKKMQRHDELLSERKGKIAEKKRELTKLELEIKDAKVEKNKSEMTTKVDKLKVEIKQLEEAFIVFDNLSAPHPPTVFAATEPTQSANVRINLRGDPLQLGEEVPRGIPRTLSGAISVEIADSKSGRMELARWLVGPKNAAVPRVFANRIWHHLFGTGIVATVDNFGKLGEAPSHPDLLDHLATRLIDMNWNVKRLIRQCVCSTTYRLSSDHNTANWSTDPENRLLWRYRPRRLDAETLRDSILQISRKLNPTMTGPTLPPASWEGGPTTDFFQLHNLDLEREEIISRRSIYLPVLRAQKAFKEQEPLMPFDFPSANEIIGARTTSTSTTQTLYLLNSPFVQSKAADVAEHLQNDVTLANDVQRIGWIYQAAYGRHATGPEVEAALEFLDSASVENASQKEYDVSPLAQFCHAIMISTEFLIHD